MEETTVQREDVLGEAIQILEIEGIANTTLEMVADRVAYPLDDLKRLAEAIEGQRRARALIEAGM